MKELEGAPTHLSIIGSLPKTRSVCVAIIGSRRPTEYGKHVTYTLAYELAKRGVVIISGLAYGIDAVAHQAALDAGGVTVAVLANGLHRIYPAAHTGLAEHIVKQGGALISEQELGVDARRYHFLARNRIISGLADAVIVTEATSKSGTLSTVSHALTQNKDVFAVPGPITSLLSVGPNRLIQQGAFVVTSYEDVLECILPQYVPEQLAIPLGATNLEQALIDTVRQGIHDGDALYEALVRIPEHKGLSTAAFLQTLTTLELQGVIATKGANQWRCTFRA